MSTEGEAGAVSEQEPPRWKVTNGDGRWVVNDAYIAALEERARRAEERVHRLEAVLRNIAERASQ